MASTSSTTRERTEGPEPEESAGAKSATVSMHECLGAFFGEEACVTASFTEPACGEQE